MSSCHLKIISPMLTSFPENIKSGISNKVSSLLHRIIGIIIVFIKEISCMFYAGFLGIWYRQMKFVSLFKAYKPDGFNYYGLNPTSLTPQEAAASTVKILVFLHGLYHNQTAALPFAAKFQKAGFRVFTFNCSYHNNDKLIQLFDNLLTGLYKGKKIEATLVGHSLGGAASVLYALSPHPDVLIKKVITIASPLKPDSWGLIKLFPKIYAIINGAYLGLLKSKDDPTRWPLYRIVPSHDWLLPKDSLEVPSKDCFIVPRTSHLNSLFSSEVQDRVIQLATQGERDFHDQRH